MFEIREGKSDAKNRKVTVRFTDMEQEFMKEYITKNSDKFDTVSELIRYSIKCLVEKNYNV